MSEDQKVALVTGASRGIGRAIATRLAADGFIVVGTATSDGGAEAISAYLKEAGNAGCGMRLDVADPDSVTDVIKVVSEQFAAPLVLVNNAGITRDNILMRMKADEWDSVIDTNLTGTFNYCRAAAIHFIRQKRGSIINLSSVSGVYGNAGQANYAASKAGLIGFTKSLARELGVDLRLVAATGRKGRIRKEDVQGYVKGMLAKGTAAGVPIAGISVAAPREIDFSEYGPTEIQPLHRVRRLSAANLHRSWVTVPHVTQFDEADITELEAFRKEKQSEAEARELLRAMPVHGVWDDHEVVNDWDGQITLDEPQRAVDRYSEVLRVDSTWSEARASLEELLEIDPYHGWANYQLGVLADEHGAHPALVEVLYDLVAVDGESLDAAVDADAVIDVDDELARPQRGQARQRDAEVVDLQGLHPRVG